MPPPTPNFAAQLETYLRHLAADRYDAVPETSRYGYLQTLLNAVGEQLPAPHVRAVIHPANRGAGIPDLALLGRPLRIDEVEAFCHSARRIAALLALGEALDTNYWQAASLHAGGG